MYCVMYILEVSGRFDVPNLLLDYYKSIAAAAVVLFLLPLRFENVLVQRILDFNDRYSYGFYLTHHIFILGSLSVMALTPYWQVNVAIAFFAAMVTGFGLIWFSDAVILMLKKYDSNNLKKRKRMVLE